MGSNAAAEAGPQSALPEMDALETSLRRLLEFAVAWRTRAEAAESEGRELQAALDAVRTGALDPRQQAERVTQLEAENAALRDRLQAAEAIAQRIHSRLQLLEEER